jgi:nucleoside-diphosphate-sugar epimerase
VWKAVDLLESNDKDLDAAIGSPLAIVSCVGVVGTDIEKLKKGNGAANVAAFASAKRGGNVKRAAFVSVSSEVAACQENWLPDFFSGYFDGKKDAELAAYDAVDGDTTSLCIIKPTFIYGGNSFGLLPPRVTAEYGSLIEELLSLPPFKFLADNTPGLIKVALRPPVSVDAVAGAAAGAALGEAAAAGKSLEGTVAIKAATDEPPATGFTDALEWSKEQATKAIEWAKVEVPKAIEWSQAKIEEQQKK